jgi:hypothetical protein
MSTLFREVRPARPTVPAVILVSPLRRSPSYMHKRPLPKPHSHSSSARSFSRTDTRTPASCHLPFFPFPATTSATLMPPVDSGCAFASAATTEGTEPPTTISSERWGRDASPQKRPGLAYDGRRVWRTYPSCPMMAQRLPSGVTGSSLLKPSAVLAKCTNGRCEHPPGGIVRFRAGRSDKPREVGRRWREPRSRPDPTQAR